MPDLRTTPRLLSPEFMAALERLDIRSRKILRGKLQGERRSKKRGQSVEFADFRPYVVGDDLRRIDWNLYARLDKLILRLFMEEEDLALTILVDTTASMDFGEPNKLHFAKQLAAALGYLGLVKQNRVSVFTFNDGLTGRLENMRGSRPVPRLLSFLDEAHTVAGVGDMQSAIKTMAATHQNPGVFIVISDFLEKDDLPGTLKYLGDPKHDAYAIQVLSPQELDPTRPGKGGELIGDLRLEDVEDGHHSEVSISTALLNKYKANLQAYIDMVRDQCVKRDVTHLFTSTEASIETLVLKTLRQRGVVA